MVSSEIWEDSFSVSHERYDHVPACGLYAYIKVIRSTFIVYPLRTQNTDPDTFRSSQDEYQAVIGFSVLPV